MRTVARRLLSLVSCLAAGLAVAPSASAAPLTGSVYDSGDGNQDTQFTGDWQSADTEARVKVSPDANDDCFIGGVKENTPNLWAFNSSAGGCTPGKSNIRVAYANPESTLATSFSHLAFFRNDTTGNTFLTFELNQKATSWTNATGTTIPCRSNGDILLSFEVGGSSLQTVLYKWTGDGTGPAACPNGANGTFVGSGVIPAGRFQGTMNSAAAIANYISPATYGSSFPANSFGEAAIDIPGVLASMGQSPCFGFLQMQVHSRSSSSISSAMIDYTAPVPIYIQSCAATGTTYQDTNGDGTRDDGEPGLSGFEYYADLNDNGALDAAEPSGTSDSTGFYRILNIPAGSYKIREVARQGWDCSQPSPCYYSRSFLNGGNSTGNDFGKTGPSTASGIKFNDRDGDGVRDAGEVGLSGWTYYVDVDGDSVKDAGEPSGVSDSTGAWSITGIGTGMFTIREIPQSGWTCSTPSPCSYAETFTSTSAVANRDFGGWAAATVAGNVFEDVDGDGAEREAGDVSLSGWQVFIDANGNDVYDFGELRATTDGSGNYSIDGLAPGSYTIRATPASASWYCTRPGATAAACERSLTLSSGQLAGGHGFGHARLASVSGTKFDDLDNDALKDAGEGALAGFTFYVDYDNDNAPDADEPTGTSDSSGTWTISGVRAGTWTLREQPKGAYACTKPTPCTYALTLVSGGTSSGYEFGNYVSRSVSGTVFNDSDADGLDREAGEPGLSDWTVYSDANNNSVKDAGEPTSVTNSLGQYNLTGLANGNYRIRIVSQAGWTCSFPTGCSNTGSIGSGQSDTGKNFGVWGPSQIAGTVFEDADADGVAREAGESGLSGRLVYVDSNDNSIRDAGEPSATSDASGAYAIAGVNPGGPYVVRQVLPAGWTCSRPSPCSYSVSVSGGDVTGRDFASSTTGSIAGNAYEDADADGLAKEAGEANLTSRTIYLDANNNGVKDLGETAVSTDVSGDYSFTGLAPGFYTVRQVLPPGWTQSAPAGPHTVTITSQAALASRNFASYTTGSIAGRLFEDADFDGSAYQAGDTLLANRVVYLDSDADGVKDPSEPQTTTNASGAYSFSGLAPGDYTVRTVMPANWACAYPASCSFSVSVSSQSAATAKDFGSYVGAAVSGNVFEDADADGLAREAGEAGLAGQRVYLDANADGTRQASEQSALTDASGDYYFTGVTAQAWQVRLELGSGWSCDSPSPCRYDVTLSSGSASANRSFGVHTTGSIAGHLFTDRDNDGQPQAFGENAQPQRTVYLDANDNGSRDAGETSVTTDDNGDYTFTGLAPGTYRVRQLLPSGWMCSTPNPCLRTVALSSRQSVSGQDFSSWTTASVIGTYFHDSDAGGEFPESGEPGVEGRTVYLDSDEDGVHDAGEPSTTTAADGEYSFSGLAPGRYVVRPASQLASWVCSYPAGCAEILTVEAGEAAQDVNFGAWTTGTVAGTVYRDEDGSGTRNGTEAGVWGWTVYADLNDDGVKDAAEPSDLTDSSGAYELALDPGTYKLREVRPDGWTCTEPASCVYALTIVSSGALSGRDFGNAMTLAQVGGVVFDDADADGAAREAGEAARSGRTVYVDSDDDGVKDSGELSATTATDGTYTITGVTPNVAHTLRVEEATGRTCSRPDPCSYTVTPAAGETLTGRDFGSWAAAGVSGTVHGDSDADGSGDSVLSGQTLYLDLDGDNAKDDGEPAATSTGNGMYSFTGLKPGVYMVRVALPSGWTCSAPSPCERAVTLASGAVSTGRDFHLQGPALAEIAGTVREDTDANETGESSEPGIAGQTVYLDFNDNASRESDEPATTTDSDGNYRFTGLKAGAHTVRIRLMPGWTCSAPASCRRQPTLFEGQSAAGNDFAAWQAASISGKLSDDINGNGSVDSGEPPLPGQAIYLDVNANGTLDGSDRVDMTDNDGGYSFGDLRPGAHSVRHHAPDGRTCTSPAACERKPTLTSGKTATGQDFATHKPQPAAGPPAASPAPAPEAKATAISGVLFEDRDADGREREATEPLLAGWTVYVDADRNGRHAADEQATTTDDQGRYRFLGLAAGQHALRFVAPSDKWVCSVPTACVRTVTLTVEGQVDGQDFAAWRGPKITGFKFEDADGDGSNREAGDKPLAGWKIYADLNGNRRHDDGEPLDVTDERGRYGLTNLPLGTLIVREEPPAKSAYRCTFPVDACSAKVTIESEAEDTTVDFGSMLASRIQLASRRTVLSAPAACQTGRFQFRVSSQLARRVVLRVDGRGAASGRKVSKGRYVFTLNAGRYSPGVHKVSARATFVDGTSRTVRATFYRCQATLPRYTG